MINDNNFQRRAKYYISPLFMKVLLLWFVVIFLVYQASATAVTTNAATSVTTNSATLNGNLVLTVNPTYVWFQYGAATGIYKLKTPNQTMSAGGAFRDNISGVTLQAGKTYYYTAVADDGSGTLVVGNEQTFTTSSLTQITGYSFDRYTVQLVRLKLNVTGMAETLPKVYTDIMGVIFWGVAFGFIFVMMWLRQEDVTIPSLVGLLIGASLWGLMPPEWVVFSYSIIIVSFAGLMYSLIKSRR